LAENEQLKARKRQLKTGKRQLKARKQQLKAELQGLKVAHDRLSSESQELRTALDRSQAAHARLSEQLDRATADLEGIRAELGGLKPAEVRSLAEERASLNSEVERLGGEIRLLRDEQSAHDRAADQVKSLAEERESLRSQVERFGAEIQQLRDEQSAHDRAADQLKRKEADLNAALAEVDRFAGLLKERDEGLETARADLHRLGVDRQSALDEAERLRSTFAEREETLRADSGRLSAEGDRLRAERDALRRALDHAEHAHRDELTRLEQRLEYAREQSQDIEALRGERDRLRADGEQLRAEGDRLRREVEELRRALDHVERNHGDDRPGLHTELAVFAEKYDQILYDESILRLFMEQQEPHQELVEGLAHLRSPRQAPIDAPSPQPRFASPSNETLPGSPQEAEQADPPEHEPAPSADPALTADDENQAARGDAEERERRLATWGKRHAEMAPMLEGMGVHFSSGHFKKR
jgi:chromosome segregation ATPase